MKRWQWAVTVTLLVLGVGVFGRAARTPNAAAGSGVDESQVDAAFDTSSPDLPTSNAIAGVEVAESSAAGLDLPFAAFDPQGLGEPVAVYQTDPASGVDSRGLVVEFDYTTEWGPVVVEELVPQSPADTWKEQIQTAISLNGQSFTHGTATEVDIRGGLPALLLVSEDGSEAMMQWYEKDNLEMVLYGTSLPSDVAVKLAEGV